MQHPVGNLLDRMRDVLGLGGDGARDFLILRLDDADDLDRREEIDVEARVEAVLRHGSIL